MLATPSRAKSNVIVLLRSKIESAQTGVNPSKTWFVISCVMLVKLTFKVGGGDKQWADRRRTWLAAASGESIWRYGMDRAITSCRLYDLLSYLLVPASSTWQDEACLDHKYAHSYSPAGPPTTKTLQPSPCTLHYLSSTSTFNSWLKSKNYFWGTCMLIHRIKSVESGWKCPWRQKTKGSCLILSLIRHTSGVDKAMEVGWLVQHFDPQ